MPVEYSEDSYRERCEKAAKHFLKSVVVIDDQAENYPGERLSGPIGEAANFSEEKKVLSRRPMLGLSKDYVRRSSQHEDTSDVTPTKEFTSLDSDSDRAHVLRAWILTEKLADDEILCTVYRPWDHEEGHTSSQESSDDEYEPIVTRSARLAQSADIVVLDWELGGKKAGDKGTQKARDIIKAIIKNDEIRQGRQRLIVVYTAVQNLDGPYSDVVADIGNWNFVGGKLNREKSKLCLSNTTTRIKFLNKDTRFTDSRNDATVSEEDLPRRLIMEFVELNSGLLPSIALHSIASIRETTHHLLSTFNSYIDPAFVSHRSLLPNPQDSEDFILDLVSDELRSALSMNHIGHLYAGVDAHKDWIAGQLKGQKAFQPKNKLSIHRDEAFKLLTKGDGAFDGVTRSIATRWVYEEWEKKKEFRHKKIPGKLSRKTVLNLVKNGSLKDLKKHVNVPLLDFNALAGVFAGNKKEGERIERDFSRLTTLKRERYGGKNFPEGWVPTLGQGSIIREIDDDNRFSDEFLCCIQPRCDSVRIKETRMFPFLRMTSKGIVAKPKQYFFVRCRRSPNQEPENIKLLLYPFPYRQTMLTFSASGPNPDRIVAVKDNENWMFVAGEGRFEWIADIRDFLAQRLCEQLSGRQGSVGLDEYEWLRRKSNS